VAFYEALAQPLTTPARPAEPSLGSRPRLQVAPPLLAATLATHGLRAQGYRVLAPGAEYGPAKCWPAEHYARLADELISRDGAPVVLLGSGKEATLTATVVAGVSPAHRARCTDLAGRTSLGEALALVAGARSLVSNDSGLMHVAAAFGIEQVAVFGSTSPEHTPPLNPRAHVLWLKDELGLDCAPCFARTCRFGHTRCLTAIRPERVAALLET
jgi:heptosyltransferase II